MLQTSKDLMKNLFRTKMAERPPFIPWVCSFAAKLEQISSKKMFSDATILSKCLRNARKLYGYDAISIVFDNTLEAEACGCNLDWPEDGRLPTVVSHPLSEGTATDELNITTIEKSARIPVVLETAKRLSMLDGREIALLGVITGPITLSKHLRGEMFTDEIKNNSESAIEILEVAQKVGLKLCRAYLDSGLDGIVVVEDSLGELDSRILDTIVAPSLQSMWNIIKYYRGYSMIVAQSCNEDQIESIFRLGADGLVVEGDVDYEKTIELAANYNSCFGRNIPCSALSGSLDLLRDAINNFNKNRGSFLSTDWEVPYQTPASNLHEIMEIINAEK